MSALQPEDGAPDAPGSPVAADGRTADPVVRNRFARLLFDSAGRLQPRHIAEPGALLDALMAVRDDGMQQLRAALAEADEESRRQAEHTDATCEAVQRRDIAEAAVARVRAVADEWGEPFHCGWLSASVLVRQLRAAIDEQDAGRA